MGSRKNFLAWVRDAVAGSCQSAVWYEHWVWISCEITSLALFPICTHTVPVFSYVYKNFYLLLLDSCWQTLLFTIFTSATTVLHNDIIIEATDVLLLILIVSIDTSVWQIYTLFFLFVYNTLPPPCAITSYVAFGDLLRIWCQYCLHEK